MDGTQSSLVPASSKALRSGDVGWLAIMVAQALSRLIRARIAFARLEALDIPARNAAVAAAERAGHADELLAQRIGFIIPRVAKRLPWRSDCLVQAIAAQDWLAANGMASELRIGVERPEDGPFGDHAWLIRGEQIVTGGDILHYTLLLGEKTSAPRDFCAFSLDVSQRAVYQKLLKRVANDAALH
jgi:hypothetical protein